MLEIIYLKARRFVYQNARAVSARSRTYTLILSRDRTSFGDRVRIERDAFHK